MHGRTVESVDTSALREDVVHMIGRNLRHHNNPVNDHNIIAVSQLIMGETIGGAQKALLFHEAGLEKMVQ
jgi:hypothetical protein